VQAILSTCRHYRLLPVREIQYPPVFTQLYEISHGTTATYGEIAARVGTSPRAVGRAMARNPTPLVVPCHRVVAAAGIGGFTPALEIKEYLLNLEKKGDTKRQKKPSSRIVPNL